MVQIQQISSDFVTVRGTFYWLCCPNCDTATGRADVNDDAVEQDVHQRGRFTTTICSTSSRLRFDCNSRDRNDNATPYVTTWQHCGLNKNLCGRDGRTICGPQCVPKSTSVTLAVDENTLPMATITGRTDRQTDGQTECDAICGAAPS